MHRVIVAGGTGKTGQAVCRFLCKQAHVEVVGVLARKHVGTSIRQQIPDLEQDAPIYGSFEDAVSCRPTVWVDFTPPEVARINFPYCVMKGIHPIIGTTGFESSDVEVFMRLCSDHELGGVLIPNFSLGALMLFQAARLAAQVFSDAVILDMYPPQKKEAPSGTTKHLLAELQKLPLYCNQEITTHSLRIDGAIPHQQIKFGGEGETVTMQHDVSDRMCFGAGVLKAIERVGTYKRLVTDLADLI